MRRSGLALLRGAASLGSSSGAYAPSSFVVTARKLVHAESPAVVAFPSCTGGQGAEVRWTGPFVFGARYVLSW